MPPQGSRVYDELWKPSLTHLSQGNDAHEAHDLHILERIMKDEVGGVQANSFYYRHSRAWNDLPANIAKAAAINAFKIRLNKQKNDEPSKFNH